MCLARLCLILACVLCLSRVYWPGFGASVVHDWTPAYRECFHLINQITSAYQNGFMAQLTFKTDNLCYLL